MQMPGARFWQPMQILHHAWLGPWVSLPNYALSFTPYSKAPFTSWIELAGIDIGSIIRIEGAQVRMFRGMPSVNILNSTKDRAFVQSMQSLAHELNIQVIAEFVETGEVLDELKRMGMDMAQGYFIGRPAPEILQGEWRREDA